MLRPSKAILEDPMRFRQPATEESPPVGQTIVFVHSPGAPTPTAVGLNS
jgi:hypothetical protein